MEKLTTIGKSIPNRDAPAKVKGSAVFAEDIKLKGMLHGKILRSPMPHARILNIDVSRAEKLKGVKGVITYADTPQIKFSAAPIWADKLPLEGEKVRYIGDEIAAVAAVDEDTARQAIDLIQVELEELPGVFDPVEAMKPGAAAIHDHVDNNISKTLNMECGDVAAGFAEADLILEDTFRTHAQSHSPIETHCCIGRYEPDGQITLWANTQAPHPLRQRLSQTMGIDTGRIRIITPFLGGGFGCKIDLDPSQVIAVILSKMSGKPVRISHTRQEQFMTTRMRHPALHELKFGVKYDGTIVAKQARVIMDNGAYNSHGPAVMAYNNVMFSTLYRVENIKYEGALVYTNKNWGGACRGYGDPQITFAQESMLDMIAERLGMDPIDLRLKNGNRPNEITANKVKITSCGLQECLTRARETSRWDEKMKNKPKHRGLGIASMIYTGGGSKGSGFNYSGATVQISADGAIHLLVGATDIGQGSNTILPQMAAEVLGVDTETIRLTTSDTDTTLPCMGTFGSRVTFCAGKAVIQAATRAKKILLEEAAELLEASIRDLELKDEKVFVTGSPEVSVSIAQIASSVHYKKEQPLTCHGTYNGPEPGEDFDPATYLGYPSPAMVFATHIAEVDVDPDTGKVEIINFVAAHDLGRAINPILVEGQIEGGVAQGIGWSLMEEMVFENGRMLNPNFHDYKMPTIRDVPNITPILVETVDPEGPFGAKGIGECAMVSTAPAIINAINNAVGVRIKDLPATSEKIYYGLKNSKTSGKAGK
jgi:4-hydroxybenzoyl-CoA reductase alpha subunit